MEKRPSETEDAEVPAVGTRPLERRSAVSYGALWGFFLGALVLISVTVYSPRTTEPGVIEETYVSTGNKGRGRYYNVKGHTESGQPFAMLSQDFYDYADGRVPAPVLVTYSSWTRNTVQLAGPDGNAVRNSPDVGAAKYMAIAGLALFLFIIRKAIAEGRRAGDRSVALAFLFGALVVGSGIGAYVVWIIR